MAFVQLSNISVAFGARDLIKSATLTLMEGSRAALAGPNGAGKSTLMKIAVGQFVADTGEIAITKGARISYLPQTNVVLGHGTVLEEAETAFSHIADMLIRQEELGRLLESKDLDEKQTARFLEEFDDIGHAVESSGYFRRAERIAEVLRGLGFADKDFGKRTSELSGGWQMRLALAKVLLEDPDIMLLDEPTNYLDLEARTWLENFLRDYRGGVLLVSHDRYFLDVTVNEVYELFNGKLSRYPGTFSAYEDRRAKELDAIFCLVGAPAGRDPENRGLCAPLPLQGHQGSPSTEPNKDAGQDCSHRDTRGHENTSTSSFRQRPIPARSRCGLKT